MEQSPDPVVESAEQVEESPEPVQEESPEPESKEQSPELEEEEATPEPEEPVEDGTAMEQDEPVSVMIVYFSLSSYEGSLFIFFRGSGTG